MRIAVINGPNLNWLGRRQPEIYGDDGLGAINDRIRDFVVSRGASVEFFQANGEGEVIDILQAQADICQGIVLNPGAYGHYSLAIADALSALTIPVIEVHLSNVFAREEIRHGQLTAGACKGYICGLGWRGYILAVEALLDYLEEGD